MDLPLYWMPMARRLIAAIVLLLLGVTPSLALACDARCLGEPAARTSAARAGHDHHSPGHAHGGTAPAQQTAGAHSSDVASPVHVTARATGTAPVHHGCKAAFDVGTADRQPVAASLGLAPADLVLAGPPPSIVRFGPLSPHASPASRGRASIPLRI